MTSQSKIILFCYAYVIGIVVAMTIGVDPSLLPLLRIATGAAFLFPVALYGRGLLGKAAARVPLYLEVLALVIPAVLLGCTRHTSADTVPDTRIGTLHLAAGRAEFRLERDLPDLCRVSIRKTQDLEGDLTLRLHGDLDARVPVKDENGAVRMDEHGRWMFRIARLTRQGETVTVRAADPVGTEYIVPQPFSRISRIEVVEGPAHGAVAIYRVSNHISTFARPGRDHAPVTILGRVTQDPNVYDFKTVLPITPDFVQYPVGGPFYKVEGGDVQVTLKPEIGGYEDFARTEGYGCSVQVQGELSVARAAANPGGFDPRRFMQNNNVYGVMSLFQPPGGAPPIALIVPEEGPVRRGSGLVRFSLDLRDRMLRVFKATMPYPQSAFLGGVTLGLRYGLHGVICVLGRGQGRPIREGMEGDDGDVGCEEQIAEEFRISGVNHVLAVSGLHVTIITVMFVGIFGLMRIPKKLFVPVIILLLVIFAIITGARPSVLRAVIMHALFLLTWAYMSQGFRSSVLLGVPVAAFLILLQNPLVVTDPSFTLSFGAILSLGLMTTPAHDLLSKLRGNNLLSFILITGSMTLIGMLHWPLMVSPAFFVPFAAVCVGVALALAAMERRGVKLLGGFGFTDVPSAVGAFLAAQVAIQFGMMIPLSAYYFCRWPFAGAYANLIAIPLIGVVVQIGALAGLLGLIPFIGLHVALVLNAANWVFSTAFLLLAHYFAEGFPYPFVRRPDIGFLVVYYIFCAAFVWREPLWKAIQGWCLRRGWMRRSAPWAVAGVLAVAATIPVWPFGARSPGKELRVTFLSLGYGESALIETPAGRRILVDCGFVEHERGRNNDAIRTIVPFLAHNGIRKLDAVLVTSPSPERVAGASYVLESCWVDTLFVPPALAEIAPEMDEEAFVDRLAGGQPTDHYSPAILKTTYNEVIGNPMRPNRHSLAKTLARRGPSVLNRWAGWDVRVEPLQAGQVLLRETHGRSEFRIEVLHPSDKTFEDHPIENGSAVVRVVYGGFSILFSGDLHFEGQRWLAGELSGEKLRSTMLVVPHHGTAAPWGDPRGQKEKILGLLEDSTAPLLEKVRPARAVFCYGNPRPVLGLQGRDAENVFELTWRYMTDALGADACLRTDRDLAITVTSDGTSHEVATQAIVNRAAGAEYTVEDISIGF